MTAVAIMPNMAAMIDLYTWDYATLKSHLPLPGKTRDEGLGYRHKRVDLGICDRQHLVEAGFLQPETTLVKEYPSDKEPTQKRTIFVLSDAGRAWLAKIEARWEERVEGAAWWSIDTSHGGLVIGIPDFLHPEEAVEDMKLYLGSTFKLGRPRTEDHSPGNPVKLSVCEVKDEMGNKVLVPWRPWLDPSRSWLDLTKEGSPIFRGAYMRIHGAPFEALAFMEGLGLWVPNTSINEMEAKHVCFIDKVKGKNETIEAGDTVRLVKVLNMPNDPEHPDNVGVVTSVHENCIRVYFEEVNGIKGNKTLDLDWVTLVGKKDS